MTHTQIPADIAVRYVEPIYYHDDVAGWHHHHTEAGAIVHQDSRLCQAVDLDGSKVLYSAHRADHELNPNVGKPCTDPTCRFAGLDPSNRQEAL